MSSRASNLPLRLPFRVETQLAVVFRQRLGMPADPQVFVVVDLLHVQGQGQRQELALVDISVVAPVQVLLQAGADLLGDLGEDVVRAHPVAQALDDFGVRKRVH